MFVAIPGQDLRFNIVEYEYSGDDVERLAKGNPICVNGFIWVWPKMIFSTRARALDFCLVEYVKRRNELLNEVRQWDMTIKECQIAWSDAL